MCVCGGGGGGACLNWFYGIPTSPTLHDPVSRSSLGCLTNAVVCCLPGYRASIIMLCIVQTLSFLLLSLNQSWCFGDVCHRVSPAVGCTAFRKTVQFSSSMMSSCGLVANDCIGDQQIMRSTFSEAQKTTTFAAAYALRSYHSIPSLVICVSSGIKVTKDDGLVCSGYCRYNTVKTLSLTSGLFKVDA